MRRLFGCLAGLLCGVSIALAARYGYKGADTEIDGAVSAVVFGLIALCACLFDAAAVRLWFMRHRFGAAIVGLIAAAALVVTFTNSLGAIAGRADTTQAQRTRAKDDTATDRADLARITKERAALAAFMPATEEDVKAAQAAVAAAVQVRIAECEKRGLKCRDRETEEQAKRAGLATVLANMAATDKAAKLEADAAAVRSRLAKAPTVQNANPLGAVLEELIGATAAALTAWQQAIVAGVFELCLVGVMVIFELLGQPRGGQPVSSAAATGSTQGWWGSLCTLPERLRSRMAAPVATAPRTILDQPTAQRLPAPPVTGTKRASPFRVARTEALPRTPLPLAASADPPLSGQPTERTEGSVRTYVLERLRPADGDAVEMKALLQEYRTWCEGHGFEPKGLADFAEDMRAICAKVGITTEAKGKRVVCRDVRLADPSEVAGGSRNGAAPHD